MNNKLLSIIWLINVFCSFPLFLNAQQKNIEFTRENFPKNKKELKEAQDNLLKGDEYFEYGGEGYLKALNYFLKAYEFNPNEAKLNYKIGVCYFYSIQKSKSIPYFEKAYQLNRTFTNDLHFLLAQAYHSNYEFDKAIEEYNKHMNTLLSKEIKLVPPLLLKKIEECKNGKELVQHPIKIKIENVGNAINSAYPDYSPLISADESMMIITSRREGSTGGEKYPEDNQYFEDVYVSYFENGAWKEVENIGSPINTKFHDATVGLSPDGQELFIYKSDKGNLGDIYVCKIKGKKWNAPQPLPVTINSPYHESAASFSYDGKTIYFVSDKPEDSYGGRDIYYSQLTKEGKWGKAINIGPTINTQYDEEGVFMHPDGKTLYFSSKGHNTMGGYDIFISHKDSLGRWSKPENIGYPLNTPDDDVFFTISASGEHGYFSSMRDDGFGEKDIYRVTFLKDETKPILPPKVTLLKGIVTDEITKEPIEAIIEIIDNEKREIIATFLSNSATGKYLVSLPSGKNYGIAVSAQNYLFHSENFIIPDSTAFREIIKDIALNKLVKGSKVILRNIFFDYAKTNLRPESYAELDRVVKLLNDHPTMRIEISGHTDNQSSYNTNIRLSKARAKAVVDYLIIEGISAKRLEYNGYAYDQPIAPNDTEEGRQLNRRVEFKILSE